MEFTNRGKTKDSKTKKEDTKKLSAKVAKIICILLLFIFGIFIMVVALLSRSQINSATIGELQAVAKNNAIQIQEIMTAAENTSNDMSSYLIDAYEAENEKSVQQISEEVIPNTYESEIYKNLRLSESASRIENYLVSTASNTARNSKDIIGVGVYFQPYAFSDDRKIYGFYADSSTGNVMVSEVNDYMEQAYYDDAAKSNQMIFTKPFVYDKTGVQMITAATPIIIDGEIQAVVAVDIEIGRFEKINVKNERYPTLNFSIVMDDGTIVYDSKDKERINKNLSVTFDKEEDVLKASEEIDKGNDFYMICKNKEKQLAYKFFSPIDAGNEKWGIANTLQASDVNEAVVKTTIILIVLAVISLFITASVIAMVLKQFLSPINTIVKAAKDIYDGNLNISLESKSNDEIGVLAGTFNNTAHYLKNMIEEISKILSSIAENDLTLETEGEYKGDFIEIKKSIQSILHNLNNAVSSIGESAEQVSSGAEQVSSGAQALSQGATEQASSIEELAATINDISEQIKNTADDAKNASMEVNSVGKEIIESNKQMQEMILAMKNISSSSNKIGKIIKTIEDIAFQTNILALNAAVEAARAGEAGKGFAVVADEVRNLASKSAEAAKNTTDLIEGSIKAVENGTQIADSTAQSLLTVVDNAKNAAGIVDGISSAAQQQAEAIQQVTLGVDQISSVVQTNSATAEESAAASEEMTGQAQLLKELVGKFKTRK